MEAKKIALYLLALVVILCFVFLPGYSRLQKLREKNRQHEKRIKLLQEHNEKLKEELAKLKEDPDYLEGKAREKLGIIKEGETVYRRKSE